MLPMQWRSLI